MALGHMLRRVAALLAAVALAAGAAAGAAWAQSAGEAPGQTVIVRAIAVEGNAEVDTEQILAQVQATRVGEPLDPVKLQEDVYRIAELGYFESVQPDVYAFQDGARVVFTVQEFPVIRAVEVTVAEEVVSPEDVIGLLNIRTGEVLNANALTAQLQRLPVLAGERLGYILQVTGVELAGEAREILALDVAPVRVGEIIIEGNEKTKDYVILRELTFKTGDILSMDAVRDSLRKLGQLGYFEPIIPDFLLTEDPLVVDVLLPVSEHKTGRAAFGAGYSSKEGLVGYVEVADTNLFGRGQTANIKWEFGKRVNMYDVSFMEPYLFGTNTSAGFSLYNDRRLEYDAEAQSNYWAHRRGGDVTLGRPLGAFTRGSLTFRAYSTETEPAAGGAHVPTSHLTHSIIASVRTDTSDHLLYPTEGFRSLFSVEAATPAFGGDTEFTKYQASFSRYVKVGRNDQTWAFRVLAGVGTGTIPVNEKFRVGGAETVRGYRYGAMQGDRMLVGQVEYRFPINQNIHGAVFYDLGKAWSGDEFNLKDFKRGGGVGIRFMTPLGVMRLDYGIGENGGQVYFSLGPTF